MPEEWSDIVMVPAEMGQFSLEGRVALVTGGNGGLGRSMAEGLHTAGAAIAITGRDAVKNAAVGRDMADALVLSADVTQEDEVEAVIRGIMDRWGRIDIVVNNAGSFKRSPIMDTTLATWNDILNSHLTGSFLVTKHVARVMSDGGRGGKIINISSLYASYGPPDFAAYAAAKAGVLGLTRATAIELAPYGIQVNSILPGWFETKITKGVPGSALGQQVEQKTPAGRWGRHSDLVGTVIYLSSPASDFVTGVTLPVDGGYLIADRLMF